MNQEDFQLCIENFQKFVNKVFSGSDQYQKSTLLQKCQNFVKIGQNTRKRTLKDAKSIPNEKRFKSEIPNDIWLKIIGFLKTEDVFCRFALVCKRFKSLTSNRTAIKRLIVNFNSIQQEQREHGKKLGILLQSSKTIVEFTLAKVCLVTAIPVITVALQSNPKLKSLKILNHLKCKCINDMDKLVQCIKINRPDLENLEFDSVDYSSKAMK